MFVALPNLRFPGILGLLLFCGLASMGCNPAPGRVQAVIRVPRQGSAGDYTISKETQAALLRSDFVLRQAQRSLAAEIRPDLSWLKAAVAVQLPASTELIVVSLPVEQREVAAAEKILDAVIQSYQNEIVSRERLEKVDLLDRLRRKHRELHEQLRKKTDELHALNEELGTHDARRSPEMIRDRLKELHPRLIDLELEARSVDASGDDRQQAALEDQLQYLREQIAEQQRQIAPVHSGEVASRQADLKLAERNLETVRVAMVELEQELESAPRITIIQRAAPVP